MISAQRDPALSAQLTSVRTLPGLRAGSGLLSFGERLLAIQDDAQAVVWINPHTLACESLVLEGSGEALRKRDKPDYEALVLSPDGSVFALGSGSRLNRHRIASLRFSAEAGAMPVIALSNASPLYLTLTDALGGTPNIEAGLFVEDDTVLRLFHRGAGDEADGWVDLAPEALSGAPPEVLNIERFELGSLGAVPLHFTDAALLPDGGILYLAAAEHSKDAVADGPVCGSAIGTIRNRRARWAPIVDGAGGLSLRKAEGIALHSDQRSGYLVTDPDNAALTAELCGFVLGGSW